MGATAAYLRQVRKQLVDREPRSLSIAGETVAVRVRGSRRARTARIIVGPRRPLEVIVPESFSDAEVDQLLAEKKRWVERKLRLAREIATRPARLGLNRPGVVWLDGEPLPVELVDGARSMATLVDGHLRVSGPLPLEATLRWHRREARRRLEEVAEREAERLGLTYDSIGVRDPKTRWGSCSRRGHLSFSWRLASAPPEVLEYVVVHELCHLREPSHSRAFWRLLEAARPGWQEQARWLREHGQELHSYLPCAPVGGDSVVAQ
jgi:predicted metal-dependent hydrolase